MCWENFISKLYVTCFFIAFHICRLLEKQGFYKNPLSKAKIMFHSGYIAEGKISVLNTL